MEKINLITAGIIGSVITLLITALIDCIKEYLRYKLEKGKLVFQRKTDAAEKAMSWYQESVDCFMMMKMACSEIGDKYNPITWTKFISSTNQANQLYKEANIRLNPLYLYFDFKKIEEKYATFASMQYINDALTEIGKYDEEAKQLRLNGKDDSSNEIIELKRESINLLHELSKALEDQIKSIVAIQEELRTQFNKYPN